MAHAAKHCRPLGTDRLFWLDGFLRPAQCETILSELEFAFWERSKLYLKTLAGATNMSIATNGSVRRHPSDGSARPSAAWRDDRSTY